MSYTVAFTLGTPPANPCSLTDLLAYIQSITAVINGTAGASDLAAGAVGSAAITPGQINWAQATFAGNVYTIDTPNGAGMAAGNGSWIFFRAPASGTNTAGTVNANVNSTGNVAIAFRGQTTLPAGVIREYQSYCLVRSADSTPTARWDLISISSLPEDHYESVATTGTNDYVATFAPTIPALVDGLKVRWKVPNSNTTAGQLNVDGLGLKAIKKNYNQALGGGELIAGSIVETVYDLTNDWWQLVSDSPASTAGAVIGDGRNVIVKTSSPTTSTITLTADELILKTTGGSVYVAPNVNVTASIGAAGAGGLDSGAGMEVISTWYFIWCIYNPSTAAVNAMFSTSATAPTMPSGYTYKALVGAVYNDSGSDFVEFYQHDRNCYVESDASTLIITGATIPTSLTSYTMTTAVPTIAREAWGHIATTSNHPVRVLVGQLSPSILQDIHVQTDGATGASGAGYASGYWRTPLPSNQLLYVQSASATPTYNMRVTGYRI
jgi:hypothetical protein